MSFTVMIAKKTWNSVPNIGDYFAFILYVQFVADFR